MSAMADHACGWRIPLCAGIGPSGEWRSIGVAI
jgi:hypothetical protein